MYFLTFDIIGTLAPIIITFSLYFQVYKVLRIEDDGEMRNKALSNPRRVLNYSFIQFICFFPGILADGVFMFQGKIAPFEIAVIISITRRSWGFLNLLAYWFLRIGEEENNNLHFDEENHNKSEYKNMVNEDITF